MQGTYPSEVQDIQSNLLSGLATNNGKPTGREINAQNIGSALSAMQHSRGKQVIRYQAEV